MYSLLLLLSWKKTTTNIKIKNTHTNLYQVSGTHIRKDIIHNRFWTSSCKIINLVRSLIGYQIMTRPTVSIVTPSISLNSTLNWKWQCACCIHAYRRRLTSFSHLTFNSGHEIYAFFHFYLAILFRDCLIKFAQFIIFCFSVIHFGLLLQLTTHIQMHIWLSKCRIAEQSWQLKTESMCLYSTFCSCSQIINLFLHEKRPMW